MKGYGPDDGARSPRIAGVTTFLRLPHVTQFDGVDVAVVGLPFDTGLAVRTGARFGPRAVREASLTIHPAYNPAQRVAVFERLSVVDAGDVRVVAGFTDRSLAAMEETLGHVHGAGAVPLGIGGDHTVTLAELRAAAAKHGPLALLHFGAHTDCLEESSGGASHPQHRDPPRPGGGGDRRVAVSPPRHARRPRLPRRVRAGAGARLHGGPLGRPRAARQRRRRRRPSTPSATPRRSSPSTSTSSTRASRRRSARPRSAGRPRRRRSRSSAAAAVSISPAPTSSRSCPSSTAATSPATVAATIAYELLSLMACAGGTCE